MSSIKKDLTKGVFWIALAKYSGIAIQLVISAILARKIPPSAFGTIAIAMVILHFLNIFADIGIGTAVVQFKQLTRYHLDSLFTLSIYIGIILAVILYWLAGVIANYYTDQTLLWVCEMMSLVILFNSLNVLPNALMRKDKRFKTIAIRTLFFQVLSGIIAVWGAFHGWEIYALLVSPILTAIGVFCVNYFNYPLRYVMRMSREAITMVFSYSFFQFAYTFFNYFSRNLDKIIIGKYFSMTQLGYYDKSYHLMMLPIQNVSFVIEPVLHPLLSSLQDCKYELAEKNRKLTMLVSNISFPIGLLLFYCGAEIIRIIYGGQWDAAIPVFRILALSLPLQMILSMTSPIYQATGKTNHMFAIGILNTFCTVSGFLIAAFLGDSIEAIAWAWDITLVINFFNSYFIMHTFTLKESCMLFFKSFIPQAINSLVVFFLMYIICNIFSIENLFVSFAVKGLMIVSMTIFMAKILKQYQIENIIKKVL